jgi:ABC-type transport system substrate-binding protein
MKPDLNREKTHKEPELQTGLFRPVKPSTPLSRRQHFIAGAAIVLTITILTVFAISVNNWRKNQELTITIPESGDNTSVTINPDTQAGQDSYTDAIIYGDPYQVPEQAKNRSNVLVGIDDGIDIINPLYSSSDGEKDLVSLIFEPLVKISLQGGPDGILADNWTFDSENKRLEFQIRPGHLFRDGRAVEAQDVIYTYQCLMSESYNGPYKGRFSDILSVEPGGLKNSVVFQLSDAVEEPDYRIFTVGILKSDYYDYPLDRIFLMDQDAKLPEGSGAYELFSINQDQAEVRLRAGFAGNIKDISFVRIASEDKIDMLKSGEIDLIRNRWDERMKIRADSLGAYNFFPSATRIESYLLTGRNPSADSALSENKVRAAVLAAVAGQDLSTEQKKLMEEIDNTVEWLYFLGMDSNVSSSNLTTLNNLAKPLTEFGINIKPVGTDWPELAAKAATGDFDLMLLPAPSNSRLPENTVLLDVSNKSADLYAANAWPAVRHEEVIIASARLQQLTINEAGYPLTSATASWTERLQNTRFFNYDQ